MGNSCKKGREQHSAEEESSFEAEDVEQAAPITSVHTSRQEDLSSNEEELSMKLHDVDELRRRLIASVDDIGAMKEQLAKDTEAKDEALLQLAGALASMHNLALPADPERRDEVIASIISIASPGEAESKPASCTSGVMMPLSALEELKDEVATLREENVVLQDKMRSNADDMRGLQEEVSALRTKAQRKEDLELLMRQIEEEIEVLRSMHSRIASRVDRVELCMTEESLRSTGDVARLFEEINVFKASGSARTVGEEDEQTSMMLERIERLESAHAVLRGKIGEQQDTTTALDLTVGRLRAKVISSPTRNNHSSATRGSVGRMKGQSALLEEELLEQERTTREVTEALSSMRHDMQAVRVVRGNGYSSPRPLHESLTFANDSGGLSSASPRQNLYRSSHM